MTKIIDRNTTIPVRRSQVFSTAQDNQTNVEIHVLQGEREMARDNRTLGRFQLTGLPAAPRGLPQIEVAFDIDANGILHVAAKDLATSREQTITITASTGLTETDIQNMVKDAESHAEEDRRRKEEIEARNRLDNLIYGTEKAFGESREKLGADEVRSMEDALRTAREALESNDASRMRDGEQELTKASHRMAEALYKSAQGATAGGCGSGTCGAGHDAHQGGEPGHGSDDTIDVEYEDVRKSA